MSENQEEQLPQTIQHDHAPSYSTPVPPLLPTDFASPTCTIPAAYLSRQQRSNLGMAFTHSPSPPLSRKPEVLDSELVISGTTTPIRLPSIENLSLSNDTEMEQNYSPTSPGSSFSPLQLPPAVPKPDMLGQNVSKEEVLDCFIGRFVGYAMKEFEKVDADCVEPDHMWQSRTFSSFALEQHNKDTNNKIKYKLVEASHSCHIIEDGGWYVHVNFIARAVDSPDELFFAEVHVENENKVLTCFSCLYGQERNGDVNTNEARESPAASEIDDLKCCYACSEVIAHPKNGALYKAGHVAFPGYYDAD